MRQIDSYTSIVRCRAKRVGYKLCPCALCAEFRADLAASAALADVQLREIEQSMIVDAMRGHRANGTPAPAHVKLTCLGGCGASSDAVSRITGLCQVCEFGEPDFWVDPAPLTACTVCGCHLAPPSTLCPDCVDGYAFPDAPEQAIASKLDAPRVPDAPRTGSPEHIAACVAAYGEQARALVAALDAPAPVTLTSRRMDLLQLAIAQTADQARMSAARADLADVLNATQRHLERKREARELAWLASAPSEPATLAPCEPGCACLGCACERGEWTPMPEAPAEVPDFRPARRRRPGMLARLVAWIGGDA